MAGTLNHSMFAYVLQALLVPIYFGYCGRLLVSSCERSSKSDGGFDAELTVIFYRSKEAE